MTGRRAWSTALTAGWLAVAAVGGAGAEPRALRARDQERPAAGEPAVDPGPAGRRGHPQVDRRSGACCCISTATTSRRRSPRRPRSRCASRRAPPGASRSSSTEDRTRRSLISRSIPADRAGPSSTVPRETAVCRGDSAALLLLAPGEALAHGFGQRYDLPVPLCALGRGGGGRRRPLLRHHRALREGEPGRAGLLALEPPPLRARGACSPAAASGSPRGSSRSGCSGWSWWRASPATRPRRGTSPRRPSGSRGGSASPTSRRSWGTCGP